MPPSPSAIVKRKYGLQVMFFLISSCFSFSVYAAEPVPLPVTEIAEGVYVHQGKYELAAPANGGAIANIGFVIGDDSVAVIDTGGTVEEGLSLKAAIRQRTAKPIRYVINTHMHPDHVLGNAAFSGGADYVGHYKLARALAARGEFYLDKAAQTLGADAMKGATIVLPTLSVRDEMDLDLGGRRLHLRAWQTAHTDNDLTVMDSKTGTFFAGDLLFVRHVPALDGSVNGWLTVIEDMKKIEAKRAVPGHGPPSVPWPQALAAEEHYLRALRDDVREAIRAGRTIGEAAKTAASAEQDAWEVFGEYNARNASSAYAELEWEDATNPNK